MTKANGVLVYAEISDNKLSDISCELLGIGRQLANELAEPLCVIICGHGVSDLGQSAIAMGANKVFVADNPLFKDFQTDSYLAAIFKVSSEANPRIVLLGQTAAGRDLAPRLSFRLETAVATDCIDLSIDSSSKKLKATRPVYGGNALATYTFENEPQLATIRAKAFKAATTDSSRKGEVVKTNVGLDSSAIRIKILDKVTTKVEGIQLEDADVVVSGGRGIGSAEGFKQLGELANLFGGAVGASRPPCDNGWVPEVLQIGITGKIVAPDIYFAVAISGSSQHISGCSGSKNIIAINKDAEANIFKVASYGIVGDWKKILPTLTEKARELLGK
jgi:electron transfer flavoprotein alpha subunit